MVFPIPTARNPIIKMKLRNALTIDLALAIVTNKELNQVRIEQLNPFDQQSENIINTVLIC
jgi:hypothetical protein